MAGQERENTGRKSRRSARKAKKQRTNNATGTGTGTNTARNEKERTFTLPRIDTIEKVPSNAPTMAIAPSDYEHIFHEATGAAQGQNAPQPPAAAHPHAQSPETPPAAPPGIMSDPEYPPPNPAGPLSPTNNFRAPQYTNPETQVTPDGYTMLGQKTDLSPNQRRVALPAHVVRASNQFSRPALARVARYLASRADPPR